MSRCFDCPRLGPQILSTGPSPCPMLFLGAKPGKHEARTGKVYSGPAGEELDELYLLRKARLRRDAVHVSNLVLCYDGKDDPPSEKLAKCCASNHLPGLLSRVRPEVVVLMGGVAQKIAEIQVGESESWSRVRLDMHRGRPYYGRLLGGEWEGWIWPSFEPALGMRDTGKMTQLMEDFENLGRWWEGKWTPPQPENVGTTDYQIAQNCRRLYSYLGHYRPSDHRPGIDTEKHGKQPFSVQVSIYPGSGRFIRAGDVESLKVLRDWVVGESVVLHNAPGDQDLLDRLGIPVTQWHDTMQEAFHLCSLPQGLKPLVYRLFGVTMQSWEDTVRPASVRALEDWMERGLAAAEGTLSERVKKQLKTKVKLEIKAGAVESILRHVLQHTAKSDTDAGADSTYDPWKALDRFFAEGLRGKKPETWEMEWLREEIGERPILGIGNCEEREAVEYACGDADWTGRVAVELERRRNGEKWKINEGDEDQ